MFTGIIEEVGTIRSVMAGGRSGEIAVNAAKVIADTKVGDSIAVNGVCLTVTALAPWGFTADVMPETLRRTALGSLGVGDTVNLERAMPANGRFGGHIVSGHIDGTGTISAVTKDEIAVRFRIRAAKEILDLIIEKGSVCIDGISLTVTDLDNESFGVSIIPHTAAETTLLHKRVGSCVNLENDVIGKYVQRLMSIDRKRESKTEITVGFLAEHGFI